MSEIQGTDGKGLILDVDEITTEELNNPLVELSKQQFQKGVKALDELVNPNGNATSSGDQESNNNNS